MKIKIVPTILTKSFTEFKDRIAKLKSFSLIQIDCADGKFVKNKTFYEVKKVIKFVKFIKYKGDLELHLMVKEPFKEIKKWIKFRKLKSVIFHYEAVSNSKKILEIIDFLHKKGIRNGLAINPETKVEKVLKLLPMLNSLLIMGVNPGWGGQKIKLKVVKLKVKKVRKLYPQLDIAVDGGVNLKNAQEIINFGVNILAMGKAINQAIDFRRIKKQIS